MSVLQVVFSSLKFVGIVFVSQSHDTIISSYIVVESSIILVKCFPFSQLNIEGFQA